MSAKTGRNDAITLICEFCNKAFHPIYCRPNSHYCSHKCYLQSIKWLDIFCQSCGRKIKNPKQITQKYCSRICYYKTHRNVVICDWCGEEFIRTRSEQKHKQTFCSHQCTHSFSSEYLVRENSPCWKGGIRIKYCGKYGQAREYIMERNKGICEKCHRRGVEAVHHKLPIRFFANPYNAHFESNLIALCKLCHIKEHKILKKSLPLLNLLQASQPNF